MSRMIETIENTLVLVGYSVRFAFKHKQLLIIPLMRIIAVIVVAIFSGWLLISFFKIWQSAYSIETHNMSSSDYFVAFACLLIFMILVGIVGTLGELVLAHAIGDLFRTGKVSLQDAIVKGFNRFGRTVIWVTTSALIHIISTRDKRYSILGDLFLLGWNLATLFIIPVFAFEQFGVYASIKRSAALFEQHFGKAAVAEFSFTKLSFVLILIPILFMPAAIYLNIIPIFFGIFLLYILIMTAFISLAHAIFTTALYFYAMGEPTGEIDTHILERSFIRKG